MAVTISGDGTSTGVKGLFLNTETKVYEPSSFLNLTTATPVIPSDLIYTPQSSSSIVLATLTVRTSVMRIDTSDNDARLEVTFGYVNSSGGNTYLSPDYSSASIIGHINYGTSTDPTWYGTLSEQHKLERNASGLIEPVCYVNPTLDQGVRGTVISITANFVEYSA